MKVIILGIVDCPHCRALIRLLKEVKDITSISYVEFSDFIENYLSQADKEAYIKRLQSSGISLPYVLFKNDVGQWKELKTEKYTKELLVSYAKSIKLKI
jgi:glutaredoxin